jgi:hypothetical protein
MPRTGGTPDSERRRSWRLAPEALIQWYIAKSSLDNEQNLVVMTDNRGATLAFRQIAEIPE